MSCLGATHIPKRWDESGKPYEATPTTLPMRRCESKGHNGEPVIAQINSSGHARAPRRPRDLPRRRHARLGVAGLIECRAQSRVSTPRPVWNPDQKNTMPFFDQWAEVPDAQSYDNGFKIQWGAFHPPSDGRCAVQVDAGRRRQRRATR
jgi:hypothetical protein